MVGVFGGGFEGKKAEGKGEGEEAGTRIARVKYVGTCFFVFTEVTLSLHFKLIQVLSSYFVKLKFN